MERYSVLRTGCSLIPESMPNGCPAPNGLRIVDIDPLPVAGDREHTPAAEDEGPGGQGPGPGFAVQHPRAACRIVEPDAVAAVAAKASVIALERKVVVLICEHSWNVFEFIALGFLAFSSALTTPRPN